MKIDFDSLSYTYDGILRSERHVQSISKGIPDITRAFSSISGVSEAGDIHGRALLRDPASAKNSLVRFSEQLNWISSVLLVNSSAFYTQEVANAVNINLADFGGFGEDSSAFVPARPDQNHPPLSFIPPIVAVGASLPRLSTALSATNTASTSAASARWVSLADTVDGLAAGLQDLASRIESENDSEATAAAGSKIREVAMTGSQFAGNARIMHAKTGKLSSMLRLSAFELLGNRLALESVTDPATKIALEQTMLATWQPRLQTIISSTLPQLNALTAAPPAAGAASIDAGFDDIVGKGHRNTTDLIQWPQEIRQAIEEGAVNAGDFATADRGVEALNKNIDPAMTRGINEAINQRNAGSFDGANLEQFLSDTPLREVSTQTAGLGASMPTPAGIANAVSPSTGAAGAGLPAAFGQPAAGGLVPGVGGIANEARGKIASAGRNMTAGTGGALSTRGGLNAKALAASPLGTGMSANQSGVGGAGSGATGQGQSGSAGRGITGGSIGGAGLGAGGGGASTSTPARGGMVPMGAGAARGNGDKRKKVKTVITQVERNPNKLALLGQPPAVIPGVIGDWVREEPPRN